MKADFDKKLKAWHLVELSMKTGEIKKPSLCDMCGNHPTGRGGSALQAHHDDYDKPLDVLFLCKGCHMKKHHGKKEQQKDNSTGDLKASLRKNLLLEIDNPVVMETHGGMGVLFERCYSNISRGVVFEKLPEKTEVLARQRPGWFVYETDCVSAIMGGAGASLPINFLDVDPYGEPWPVISAFFECGNFKPEKLGLVVNDGLRQKLKMNGGWNVRSLREKVQQHGNGVLYKKYLEICKEMVKDISGPHGYKITKWAGYYCGHAKQMTHYAAVLCR